MASETVTTDGQGFVYAPVASTTNDLHALGPEALALDTQVRPGDSDYQILPTDRYVVTNAVLGGAWTWTLPPASSVSRGWAATIADSFGACNLSTNIVVPPSGSDTINSLTSALIVASPYGYVRVRSDGVSNWTIVDQHPLLQTAVGDSDYTILPTETYVVTSTTLTAIRTWTLPLAASVSAGWEIVVLDAVGAISVTNTLIVTRAGSDQIAGADGVGDSIAANDAYSWVRLRSDGVSRWGVIGGAFGFGNTQAGVLGITHGGTGRSTAWDGWVDDAAGSWWYVTAYQIEVTGPDATGYLTKGTKVSWDDGSVKYGVVGAVTFSAGSTFVDLIVNNDYVVAANAITEPRYSYDENPQGFPTRFSYTPTFTGYSANPTSLAYGWTTKGTWLTYFLRDGADGTSNSTGLTVSLPVAAATVTNAAWAGAARIRDNSTNVATPGLLVVTSGVTAVNVTKDWAAGLFTASLLKRIVYGNIEYPF